MFRSLVQIQQAKIQKSSLSIPEMEIELRLFSGKLLEC